MLLVAKRRVISTTVVPYVKRRAAVPCMPGKEEQEEVKKFFLSRVRVQRKTTTATTTLASKVYSFVRVYTASKPTGDDMIIHSSRYSWLCIMIGLISLAEEMKMHNMDLTRRRCRMMLYLLININQSMLFDSLNETILKRPVWDVSFFFFRVSLLLRVLLL